MPLGVGTAALSPSEPDVTAVRKYVEAGGVLLIDACGGSKEFDAAVVPERMVGELPA